MILSRREFLKLSSLALSATILPPTPLDESPRSIFQLGRATRWIRAYARPSFQSEEIGVVPGDTVFAIYASVTGAEASHNPTWYYTRRGYVHSGVVQPVRWEVQTPLAEVPEGGFLGEISVPVTRARAWYHPLAAEVYRLYYSTTYWINEVRADDEGRAWYRIAGEREVSSYWVEAAHVRPIAADEVSPISPGVADKRIEVDLARQTFRCFEGSRLVLDTLCSTGIYLRTENGRRVYGTPAGEWAIDRKRPTRHMAGDDAASVDFFDLPGVPWVSYFHWWGTAVHGTYWHNDYGAPHSHGCINVTPEIAKWVFRWTQPRAPLSEKETLGAGTPLIVF